MITDEEANKILNENRGKRIYLLMGEYHSTIDVNREHFALDGFLRNKWGTHTYLGSVLEITTEKPLSLDEASVRFGSDPEFFYTKEKQVIPSVAVLKNKEVYVDGNLYHKIIVDGFQGELNPYSDTCRQVAGSHIGRCVVKAYELAKENGSKLSLKMGHVITDDVWKSVDKDTKKFGCSPTDNVYEQKFKRTTGLREKFRAAGGHIHIGSGIIQGKSEAWVKMLVQVMDIVVGNTCVLIDRDPDNARRRKQYGRAGEYRRKEYGIEYRVPSNFWLKHYVLWSFVSSLCRNALSITYGGFALELIERFDMKKVRKAINENNYELAWENFLILEKFLIEKKAVGTGLGVNRLERFKEWASMKNPLWFCDSLTKTVANWRNKIYNHNMQGFEAFLYNLQENKTSKTVR